MLDDSDSEKKPTAPEVSERKQLRRTSRLFPEGPPALLSFFF
jgi:hypothetical protein